VTNVRSAAPEGFSTGFTRPAHTIPDSLGATPRLLVSITAFAYIEPQEPAVEGQKPPTRYERSGSFE